MFDAELPKPLPPLPGVGYKPQHFAQILAEPGEVAWLEVHAENYMGAGGRPHAQLRHLADQMPLSVHGVGLSIGGEAALDADHLDRLKALCDWAKPASFSEHLAWSTHEGIYLNDLLPLPYCEATLARVAHHIDQVQTVLGRQMLLENPSSYLAFAQSDMDEAGFLAEVARRTGCGLLLDVNNVFVSATNLHFDPYAYLAAFPLGLVGELHLGGHATETDEYGDRLLIDNHGAAVVDPVWDLYRHVIVLGGPKPTLIEWDNDVPGWPVLQAEAARAAGILSSVSA